MELGLSNKRVLITGGTSGLGAAIGTAFAAEGARVAINYLAHPEEAERLATAWRRPGQSPAVLAIHGDISDPSVVSSLFGQLDAEWGGIDVLVNNAGIDGPRALAWESDPAEWEKVLKVNLRGPYLCAREALKRMVAQRAGVILNTTSVHEVIAWSGYSAYAASKAGLSMMVKTLAQEAGAFGVRVLSIAPGAIGTAINADVRNDPASERDLVSKIALGRVGKPEEIAGLAVVLASDVASYVTGTSVFVDGGMTDYPAFEHGG